MNIEEFIKILSLNNNHLLITSVTFSRENGLAATGALDKTIKVWDLGGELLWSVTNTDWVNFVAFSLDGEMVACTTVSNSVKVFNTQDGKILWNGEYDFEIKSVVLPSHDKLQIEDLNGQVHEIPFHEV